MLCEEKIYELPTVRTWIYTNVEKETIMNILLNNRDSIYIDILNYLEMSSSKNTTLSAMELPLKQTRITLSKKITELNEISKDNNFGFTIVMSLKGVFYDKSSNFSMKKTVNFFIKRSLSYQYILSLFSASFTTPSAFCNDNFISSSLLYSTAKKIKEFLFAFKISININKNIFVGSEKNIRYFLLYFFWVLFPDEEWPYYQVKKTEMILLLNQLKSISDFEIPLVDEEKTYHFMAIIHTRILSGEIISSDELLLEIKSNNQLGNLFPKASKAIYYFYDRTYAFKSKSIVNEVKFFITIINTLLLHYNNPESDGKTYSLMLSNQSEGYKLSLTMIDCIQEIFGCNLEKNMHLLIELTKIHTHLIFFYGLPTVHNLENIKLYYSKEYPVAVNLLTAGIKKILIRHNFKRSCRNITFLLTHYLPILSSYINFYNFNKKVSINIICILPYLIESEFKNKLNNSFPNKISFTDIDTYDLILTEFPLKESIDNKICFDYPLTAMSYELIFKEIEFIFKKKNQKFISSVME